MRLGGIILFAALVIAAGCSRRTTGIQNSGEGQGRIDEMITSKNFVFRATTAIPARGRTIQLTTDYTLVVKPDTVIADLPYFGRAYTAPIGRPGGGIEFRSTDFTYTQRQRKNGSYEIEIQPNDHNDVQRMFLTISESGYGNLHVTSQNRQAISFNGRIEERQR